MKKEVLFFMLLSFIFLAISSFTTCSQPVSKPTISLMVWDGIAKEEGCNPAEFYFYRAGGEPSSDIVVYFDISGTATNGQDFSIRDHIRLKGNDQRSDSRGWGTQPQTSLIIKPVDDMLTEGDETVTITLRPDLSYNIDPGNSTRKIVIQDNEIPDVQFLLSSSNGVESSPGYVKVILSKSISKNVEISYNISGALTQNFRSSSGTLTIPAGSNEGTVVLDKSDDDIAEDDETVIFEIIHVTNANIGLNKKHFYTILNDDGEVQRSSIYDKICGIILGSRGGSSLGAVVEWTDQIDQIEKLYGVFHEFIPYNHYDIPWSHPAGSTEDGIERQKYISTAIIEKQGRIVAEDLARVWVRDFDFEKMNNMTQPYDRILTNYVKWGVNLNDLPDPPVFGMPFDLGEHIHLTARVFHPIPIINAGDPESAIEDMKEIGRLYYQNKKDDAFAWGGVYNAAIALAMLPDANVNSVIEGALKFANPEMKKEIERGLAIADKYKDPMDRRFREDLNNMYSNPGSPYFVGNRITRYVASSIYENVTCAFSILKISNGNVDLAVKIAINRGRDTDCTAASAGALAGALTGTTTIPEEWMKTLDQGMMANPYTVSHMPDKPTSQALYRALQNKLTRMAKDPNESVKKKKYLELMRKSGVVF